MNERKKKKAKRGSPTAGKESQRELKNKKGKNYKKGMYRMEEKK